MQACMQACQAWAIGLRQPTCSSEQMPFLMSFSRIWGVQKNMRAVAHCALRLSPAWPWPEALSSTMSAEGTSRRSLQAASCCATRGLVGARNTTLPGQEVGVEVQGEQWCERQHLLHRMHAPLG
jgi:hypothetical protein